MSNHFENYKHNLWELLEFNLHFAQNMINSHYTQAYVVLLIHYKVLHR